MADSDDKPADNDSGDNDFAAMFAETAQAKTKSAGKRPRVGDQIKGKVISVGKDTVFVDVGGKAEGALERSQVTDKDGKLMVNPGDLVEARVVGDQGGSLQLRIRVGRGPEAKAELTQAMDLGIPVEGTVTEVVKGGVSVDVAGVRGFVPASQMDARFVEDLSTYVGQRLTFKITRYEASPRGGNLVLSRRVLVEEENQKLATETRKKLVPGAVLRGKVVGFKPFGAFVDIGGIEGMLHVSELGYARVEKPEDILTMGQEVDVAVLEIKPGEKGDRISLSLKALADDPFRAATTNLHEGSRVKGTITRLQPFGAFIEIMPGVEGLVHISELGAGKRINHPKEAVEVGQTVEATVLAVDHERRRLSLSLGAGNDGASPEDMAAAKPNPQAKLGTFGDLLAKFKKK